MSDSLNVNCRLEILLKRYSGQNAASNQEIIKLITLIVRAKFVRDNAM